MHVLVIPSWYPASPEDVHGIFFRQQAQAMTGAGLQMGVLAPQMHPVYGPAWRRGLSARRSRPRVSQEEGLNVVRVDLPAWLPKARWIDARVAFSQLERAFRVYVRRFGRPDVLHAHSLYPAGFLTHLLAAKYGLPWVLTEHRSLGHMPVRTALGRRAEQQVAASAAKRIGVSRGHADFIAQRLGGQWDYVPNLLPPELETVTVLDHSHKPLVVGHLSVLDPVKRPELVIESFAAAQLGADAQLIIGGPLTDEIEASLRQCARQAGVEKQLELPGMVKDVAGFNQQLDVFVLPSITESFGMVLIEALATGAALVATDTWGANTVIGDGDGVVVASADPAELGAAIRQVSTWPRDRAGRERRRESCLSRFALGAFAAKYKEIYAVAAASPHA